MKYHVSPDGPRKCDVDEDNPNSRGCKYAIAGEPHFNNIDEANTYYQEQLAAAFGVIEPIRVGTRARNAAYKAEENVRAAATAVKEAPRNAARAAKAKFNGIKADIQTSKAFTAMTAMYKDTVLKAKTARDNARATARAKFNSLRDAWNEEAESARVEIQAREATARLKLEQRQHEREQAYVRKQVAKAERAEDRRQMIDSYKAYIKAESKQKFANLLKGGVRGITNVKEFMVGDHYSARERIASIRDMGNGKTKVTLVGSGSKSGPVGRQVTINNNERLTSWVRRNSAAEKAVGRQSSLTAGAVSAAKNNTETYNRYFKPVHQSRDVTDAEMAGIRQSLSLIGSYGYKNSDGSMKITPGSF